MIQLYSRSMFMNTIFKNSLRSFYLRVSDGMALNFYGPRQEQELVTFVMYVQNKGGVTESENKKTKPEPKGNWISWLYCQ